MRSTFRASIRSIPKRTVESAFLDCINRGEKTRMAVDELVMAISSGKPDGFENRIARLYTEMRPQAVISFMDAYGVPRMQVVTAYETIKKQIGCRSPAFEQALAGQFVFTS